MYTLILEMDTQILALEMACRIYTSVFIMLWRHMHGLLKL